MECTNLEKESLAKIWSDNLSKLTTTSRKKLDSMIISSLSVNPSNHSEKNNYLTTENMKLKTKIMNLEK